jgi:hypothetical protein
MNKRYIISAIIIAVLGLFLLAPSAKAVQFEELDKKVLLCVFKQQYFSAGWSAVYGGAVLGTAAAIGVASAPVSVPVAATVGVIGGNVVVGGLVGAGSSFITRISDQARFDQDLVVSACVKEIKTTSNKMAAIAEEIKEGAKKQLDILIEAIR